MGSEKVSILKDSASRINFTKHLLKDIEALEIMLEKGLFEKGIQRIGTEQELCFVTKSWRPAPIAMEVLDILKDEHFTTEYLKFNLEINLDPLVFTGNCFSLLEKDLDFYLKKAEKAANQFDAHIIQIGVLPTIRRSDITLKNLTPLKRYRALTEKLRELRGSDFEFRIEGTDELITKDQTTLFEGCTTSFQVHFQVEADKFASSYNWAQAVLAPVMAIATNSPIFLGKRLWRESRIALFQQAIDTRKGSENFREESARVSFGNEWLKNSALDYYQDNVSRYQLLLQTNQYEDSLEMIAQGKIPKLRALNVHSGTVYKWNRACYGVTDGKPHLRIENRVFPSGPSSIDQIANAALWLGIMNGMPPEYSNISQRMEFDHAKSNFLKAAKVGMGASFKWVDGKQITSTDLLKNEMLPIARAGLEKAKVDQKDIDRFLGIIEKRINTSRTGSQWQLDSFNKLRKEGTKDEAIIATTAALFKRQQKNIPVHDWSLAKLNEAGDWKNRYKYVNQIMSTDLFTVRQDDLLDFVSNIMNWRKIRHVPVENEKGELVGLITARNLIQFLSKKERGHESVEAIMTKNPITVSPESLISEALRLMLDFDVGCLPVVQDKRLAGIITEHDLVKLTARLWDEATH
jgi:CBS domain-containing protein